VIAVAANRMPVIATDAAASDGGRRWAGTVLITASAIAFSLAGLFTRLIDLDVWTVLFWRALFGGLFIAAYVVWQQGRRVLPAIRQMGIAGIAVMVSSALATICFINALRLTSVADVLVINATAPFITAVLAYLWTADREHWTTLAASLLALVGVVVMVSGALASGRLLGDLLALVMTILISGMMVIVRRNRNISMLPAAALSAFLCALLVAPVAHPVAATAHDLLYLALFGTMQFGLGLLLLTLGTRLISATRSALIGSLETPLAPAWVWLAVGEVPASATVVGGLIVLAAILADILVRKSSAGSVRPEQPALQHGSQGGSLGAPRLRPLSRPGG
jgi:drug/metabolite transporter (DMT)-like permease